ncbi:hypothetical protein HW555_000578 [Spodoptera exigua]|uniref:CCHC-type domain-containing protein n=1 Tax=Spodoptera exigua TaxID=7107 RepID=A0A835GRC8_SPOEX|nr:hypothetical protein HW555_000578 [Spodoptera exigua]
MYSSKMEKLRFTFAVLAASDGKTNVICITSIETPDGCVYDVPDEQKNANKHTNQIRKIYLDAGENVQFNDLYLEEITEDIKSSNNNYKSESEHKNFVKIADKFLLEKFSGRTSNVNQWIEEFETECERFEILQDESKIEILKHLLEKQCLDWYTCNFVFHQLSSFVEDFPELCFSSEVGLQQNIPFCNAHKAKARKIYTPPRSDARSPEHKEPTYSDQVNFFEEFTKFFKGRDRESFLSSSMNNVIPEFDPLLREQTIDVWLYKVDECAEIYNWNDKQTAHFALPKLTGHAKTWYQGLPSIKHSWLEWKRILRESFPSTENYAELLTEMLNRRTRPGESLELYYFSKINLLNRCKIFGKQAVDCIVFGIEDKGLRIINHETCVILGGILSRRIRAPQAPLVALRESISSVKSQPKGNLTCFNCNDPGHMSWQCRKPLNKCTDCNYLGHNSNDCPKKSKNSNNGKSHINNTQEKSKSVFEVLVNDDEDDKYKIVIKVNGLHTPCQVDLGSQATLIRKMDADKLGLVYESVQGPMLRGLGNIPYLPIGKVFVCIEIQDVKEEQVEAYIVDNSLINMPVLLGHSFTERPGLRIVKTASDLRFERVRLDNDVKLSLVTTDDVDINIGKLEAIPINSDGVYSGNVYVGGSIRGQPGMEYYLLPGEYQLHKGMGHVFVQNIGPRDLRFRRGSLISRAIAVETRSLDVNKDIDTETMINLIVMGLPDYVMNNIDRTLVTSTARLCNEIGKQEYTVTKKNFTKFTKNVPDNTSKYQKEIACKICEKLNKGIRYHPEEKCWFKQTNEYENRNKYFKNVNNTVLDIELNDNEQKNE